VSHPQILLSAALRQPSWTTQDARLLDQFVARELFASQVDLGSVAARIAASRSSGTPSGTHTMLPRPGPRHRQRPPCNSRQKSASLTSVEERHSRYQLQDGVACWTEPRGDALKGIDQGCPANSESTNVPK